MRPSPTLCFAILKISHFSCDTLLFFLFCDIVHGSFLESDFSIFFFFFFLPFTPLTPSSNLLMLEPPITLFSGEEQ